MQTIKLNKANISVEHKFDKTTFYAKFYAAQPVKKTTSIKYVHSAS